MSCTERLLLTLIVVVGLAVLIAMFIAVESNAR
jgi:hypothetical protein